MPVTYGFMSFFKNKMTHELTNEAKKTKEKRRKESKKNENRKAKREKQQKRKKKRKKLKELKKRRNKERKRKGTRMKEYISPLTPLKKGNDVVFFSFSITKMYQYTMCDYMTILFSDKLLKQYQLAPVFLWYNCFRM